MWIDKLADGVLQIDTPIGPRFVRLTLQQRAYLIWMFRNFPSLPQQVLSLREQRFIDRLCDENGFTSMPALDLVIGRIENRIAPQPDPLPLRKPVAATKSPVRTEASA